MTTRTSEVLAAALANGMTPVEYMLTMMRDGTATAADRKWAAEKSAPFVHPRPAPVARTIEIELPDTSTPEGMVRAAASIIKAAASGKIAPSEAQSLMAVIETQRKTVETVEIIGRLDKLEADIAERNTRGG